MVRLLFVVVVAAGFALVITSLHAAIAPRLPGRILPTSAPKATAMPAALKTLSYGLLLLLMFGIVTGWIGG